MMADTNAGQVK